MTTTLSTLTTRLLLMLGDTLVFSNQANGDPVYAGVFTGAARNIPLEVQVLDYANRETLIEQIKNWLERGTSGLLVATLDDGQDYQIYATVQSFIPDAKYVNYFTMDKCVFEGASHAIKFVGGPCSLVTISNCIFCDIKNTVLEFEGTYASEGINISNLLIESLAPEAGADSAFVFKNCKYLNINNLLFYALSGSTGQFAHAIRLENCDYVNINNVITEGFPSGTALDIVNSTRIYTSTMTTLA
jgi:hypothetical protein